MQGNFKYPRIKKIHEVLEKIMRFDLKGQNPLSCNHMNCCLQNQTKHHFTYFLLVLLQDKFKNSRIIKIQQVHQKLSKNMIEYWNIYFYSYFI